MRAIRKRDVKIGSAAATGTGRKMCSRMAAVSASTPMSKRRKHPVAVRRAAGIVDGVRAGLDRTADLGGDEMHVTLYLLGVPPDRQVELMACLAQT